MRQGGRVIGSKVEVEWWRGWACHEQQGNGHQIVKRLPEDMPLAEIAREIELLAGIKTAREQARRREGVPAVDARKLVDAWLSK